MLKQTIVLRIMANDLFSGGLTDRLKEFDEEELKEWRGFYREVATAVAAAVGGEAKVNEKTREIIKSTFGKAPITGKMPNLLYSLRLQQEYADIRHIGDVKETPSGLAEYLKTFNNEMDKMRVCGDDGFLSSGLLEQAALWAGNAADIDARLADNLKALLTIETDGDGNDVHILPENAKEEVNRLYNEAAAEIAAIASVRGI